MFKEISCICLEIQRLIENEFPGEREFNGIVANIYNSAETIYFEAEQGIVDHASDMDWGSKIRQFVDDTTHYDSLIIYKIEELDNLVQELKFR